MAERSAPADASARSGARRGLRRLVLTVPDWPAIAAAADEERSLSAPLAVLRGNRIVSANASARTAGAIPGTTSRTARMRCPELVLAPWDPDRDGRVFASSVSALESLVARFSVVAPGTAEVPVASLRRISPDETTAAAALLSGLTAATGWEVFAGIADTLFAARLAAADSTRVPPGETPAFLAARPLADLACAADADGLDDDLLTTLSRLGLRTLGDLAALPRSAVRTRFGTSGLRAHLLASGEGEGLRADAVRLREHRVEVPLDPPTTRTDVLAFAARTAAAQLFAGVRAAGLSCPQVQITLRTDAGEEHARTWRLESMDDSAVADRTRWQADGWLASRPGRARPPVPRSGDGPAGEGWDDDEGRVRRRRPRRRSGCAEAGPDDVPEALDGIGALVLAAAELTAPLAAQPSLLDADDIAPARALERLQGLFGADAVLVPGIQGGRDPEETALWTPWGQAPSADRRADAPWPGSLPAPRPIRIRRTPVELLDAAGASVVARASGLETAPALLRIPGAGELTVCAHSAAWPLEADWWDPERARRAVRLQIVASTGAGYLLTCESGRWRLLGEYA